MEQYDTQEIRFQTDLSKDKVEELIRGKTFYHEFQLSNGMTIPGWYKIAETFKHLELGDLRGKRVLDIGPASGFFSFYFASLGAKVTAIEIVDRRQFNRFGHNWLLPAKEEPASFNESVFLAMRDILNYDVEYLRGSVYQLGTEITFEEKFDFVFIGSLLVHLRDPIGALCHAASVCDGEVMATGILWETQIESPVMKMVRPFEGSIDWWLPNKLCFQHWFEGAGLGSVTIGDKYLIRSGASRRDSRSGQDTDVPVPHWVGRGQTQPAPA